MSTRTTVPFHKYHGLGNDFLIIDCRSTGVAYDQVAKPDVAVALCDRHLGVGGDGLLIVTAAEAADAQMTVINADGSRPQMCGNGIRCVAKYLRDHDQQFAGRNELVIATDAGAKKCDLSLDAEGRVATIRVEMGRAEFDRAALPMTGEGPFVDQVLRVADNSFKSTAVSMGNPHIVTFVDLSDSPEELARRMGPLIETHPQFPERTNVEFAKKTPALIELWVWERGCGITQACGTGACATAAAAVATGRLEFGVPVDVKLPGGLLSIEVAPNYQQVWMTGPATEVFSGETRLLS